MSSFGIHWSPDGIAFLEQGGPKGGANALGLAVKSPFVVQSKRPCNHNVPLAAPTLNVSHQEVFAKLANDPLVIAMLPRPKKPGQSGLWYVNDDQNQLGLYLQLLSRMSSPVHSVVQPIWSLRPEQIVDELGRTNIQPLVLIGVQPKDAQNLSRLATAAQLLPRQLILTGDGTVVMPQLIQRIPTKLPEWPIGDLIILPWEVYGAHKVRKYMRNEE